MCAPPELVYPKGKQQYQPITPVKPGLHADTDYMRNARDLDIRLTDFSPAVLGLPQAKPKALPKTYGLQNTQLSFKPLGPVGHYQIPEDILQQLHPAYNAAVKSRLEPEPFQPPPLFPYSQPLHDLILSLQPDHIQLVDPDNHGDLEPLYHASAFLIPKVSSNKLSLILHLRRWNKSQMYLPPAFKLPSVHSLRKDLLLASKAHSTMFFATWDVKNFYWSLKGLSFRFATLSPTGSIMVWVMHCIPFGWDKACYLGQSLHINIVSQVPRPLSIQPKVYIDDGLAMGPSQHETTDYTHRVMDTLADKGFILSEKSKPEAALNQDYIGKNYSNGRIANTPKRLASLLALYMAILTLPTLSPLLLTKLMGVSVYACCHTSNYASMSLLRLVAKCQHYTAPTYQLAQSLAATMAVAMAPWQLQGFFPLIMPDSPHVYVDAGPYWIGIVYFHQGHWQQTSYSLPPMILKIPINQRQQSSELWGVWQAIKLCNRLHILEPTLILDSASAFYTVIKGSTTIKKPRAYILLKIQTWVLRCLFRAYVLMINTRFHPADSPSREPLPDFTGPVTPAVMKQLDYIRTHPALLTVEPKAYDPDLSSNAWATPQWMRKVILRSPVPPTLDLFADQTNALTKNYCSLQQPFTEAVFQHPAVFFYQPPYEMLSDTWPLCRTAIKSMSAQLWGLVPAGFFSSNILPHSTSHCCSTLCHVDYDHTSATHSPGAKFESVLFFFSPSVCMCKYIKGVFSQTH